MPRRAPARKHMTIGITYHGAIRPRVVNENSAGLILYHAMGRSYDERIRKVAPPINDAVTMLSASYFHNPMLSLA